MNLSICISFLSFLVSVSSVFLSYRNNERFASHQFINKQIDVLTDLLKMLHEATMSINFIPKASPNATFSIFQHALLFEIPRITMEPLKDMGDLDEALIVFDGHSNQLLNCKAFIDHPFMPKSIADALLPFYSTRMTDHSNEELKGEKLVLLKTGILETGIIGAASLGHPATNFKQSDAPALKNWSAFCQCINGLENAIIRF